MTADSADSQAPMAICPACGAASSTKFCGECGSPIGAPGGARALLREEAVELVGLDRRLLRTLRDLLVHPVRIIACYMRGDRGRYVAPLRLMLSLTGIYMVALFFLQPAQNTLSSKLAEQARSTPAVARFQKQLQARGITPEMANERYESRLTAVMPLTSALSVLPLMVLLRLMHRRRSRHEHLMFLLGLTNVSCLYGLLALPLLAVGMKTFMTALLLALTAAFAVVYFKIYPGRSIARTTAAFVLFRLMALLIGFTISVIMGFLVIASLRFF